MTMSKEISDGFRQVAADQISQDISIADTYVKKTSLATVATTGSYTDLSNLPSIPDAVTVDSSLSSTSTNPVQNKVIKSALDGKQATGNYALKSEIPTVPTKTSQLTNDSGFLTSHQDISGKLNTSELTTALQELITEYGGEVPT
jgi:hypothetical protein